MIPKPRKALRGHETDKRGPRTMGASEWHGYPTVSHNDTVLAFDPGSAHVGVATWAPLDDKWLCVGANEIHPDDVVSMLHYRLAVPPRAVAYEGFRVRSGTPSGGNSLRVIQVIGAIRALCEIHTVPAYEVSPSDRSAALKRLKAAGIHIPGKGPHAKDAVAVGLAHLKITTDQIARTPTP